MPAGRPRTVSLEPPEMIALGKEMIAWLKLNQASVLHLSEWYCVEKGFLESEWETMQRRPEFVGYYEQALKIIGKKYLDKDSNVRNGISERWMRTYYKDLREREDAEADAEAARRANALKTEAKALEEEKQKVLQEVQRNKRKPK